jgi:hypothetical protein
MIEGRREAGFAIATGYDFRTWPNVPANERERSAVFLGAATSKENSRAVDLFGQLSKDFAQTLRGCQAPIRRRQLSLIDNRPLRWVVSFPGRRSFDQYPPGFCSASFDAEDALACAHSLTVGQALRPLPVCFFRR